MGSFDGLKTLVIFFGPILLPKAIGLIRSFRNSIKNRPPPRSLPTNAARAVNILFCATAAAFFLSLPFNSYPEPNIFYESSSRFTTPTDLLFSRLARQRPDGILSAKDALLKEKFGSPAARKLYLRFGPDALIACPYCSFDSPQSYLLYYIPFNTLFPHLLHLLILGLVTSAPIAGDAAARWRNKFIFGGISFALADLFWISYYDSSRRDMSGITPPVSMHCVSFLVRLLAFAVFDAICAGLIYLSATNRLFYTAPSAGEQVEQAVLASTSTLMTATSKMHAVTIARNAIVRDKALKSRDDAYWRAVVAMESSNGSIWEEEEVVKAMSRAMQGQGQNGGVDVAKLGSDANSYVDGVTAGLEFAGDNS